jgi:hypothetical protein
MDVLTLAPVLRAITANRQRVDAESSAFSGANCIAKVHAVLNWSLQLSQTPSGRVDRFMAWLLLSV